MGATIAFSLPYKLDDNREIVSQLGSVSFPWKWLCEGFGSMGTSLSYFKCSTLDNRLFNFFRGTSGKSFFMNYNLRLTYEHLSYFGLSAFSI